MVDLSKAHDDRGSIWRRWDPHIHTPGTVLNDQYSGTNPWEAFLARIEASDPPIEALGITDYFGVEPYERVQELKRQGRLPNVGLVFPNVELRLNIETNKGSALNLHLLFSPDDPDHIDRIKRFLLEFEFQYLGENFRCQRDDFIRLGRAHKPEQTDPEAARAIGANQFKVSLDQLRAALQKHEWVKHNMLIAVAGGQKDGTSGLRDANDSWAAQRKNIEKLANIVFSSNPKQIAFWLGQGSLSVADLEEQYNGRKPCLHGSDAHGLDAVGVPAQQRNCWIKGDLSFESLRQVCLEPEERVVITPEPPRGGLQSHTIESLQVTNAPWLRRHTVPLNPGLVAVVGARGSGKTALADLIAAGGLALSPHLNRESFVQRAQEHLAGCEVELIWETGEKTSNELTQTEIEDILDTPHVQYLSQQFVSRLCSAEDTSNPLNTEIERVIFRSHVADGQPSTANFGELLEQRLEGSRRKREQHEETLRQATINLTEERTRRDCLPSLKRERAEKINSIAADQRDLKSLVPKGNEERAKRLEEVSQAAEQKRVLVEKAQLDLTQLQRLAADVHDVKVRRVVTMLQELKRDRANLGFSQEDWAAFQLVFAGDVDAVLARRKTELDAVIANLQGAKVTVTVDEIGLERPIIAATADLTQQKLSVLDYEVDRLRQLVGTDQTQVKRYTALSQKIARAETALRRLNETIGRAEGADVRIKELRETRRGAYAGVFEAIVEEEQELRALYEPIRQRIQADPGSMARLGFSVRRIVDLESWAKVGEGLLDLRTGPFRGRGQLLKAAQASLLVPWREGTANEAAVALKEFVKANEENLRNHMPEDADFRQWANSISDWLYSTDHIKVAYSLEYDGVAIEQLSPGTRGIVLLLLYLSIDAEDDRPLIIDQPEENLDPQSVFDELVERFREAKKRRQIIIVTHNANLVVNTDADQVIVASCNRNRLGQLPEIAYDCGGLENPSIRQRVCEILEGGERAFRERAKRLRVAL